MAKKRNIETDVFGFGYDQPINQKQKGNRNEVEAANALQLWTGHEFVRTPSSGGRHFQNAKSFCGDVVCVDDDFEFAFAVETKHKQKLFMPKVLRTNSAVFTIWKQAVVDAKRAKKYPMAMLRENGMPSKTWIVWFGFAITEFPIQPVSHGIKGNGADRVRIYGYDSQQLFRICYEDFVHEQPMPTIF